MIPAFINTIILLAISAIHIFWAFGGRWGLSAALPQQNGKRALNPGPVVTLFVAIIFATMAGFYQYKIGQFNQLFFWVPNWLSQYGLWILASVFMLRAIGDFRYVGFFKKVRKSQFAELDTTYYSPLCLLLSINTILVIYLLPKP
ncbi:DUF3995 domain-containing protein [Spirosoma daeguense]